MRIVDKIMQEWSTLSNSERLELAEELEAVAELIRHTIPRREDINPFRLGNK